MSGDIKEEKQKEIMSANFILAGTSSQKALLANFNKLKVSINLSDASRKLGIPVTTIYDAWKRLCDNNRVEMLLFVNDSVIGRAKADPGKQKK